VHCSTPADHEYWRLREEQAEAHKQEIEAARARLAETGEEAAQAERVGGIWGGGRRRRLLKMSAGYAVGGYVARQAWQ
jgi:hypothetical protein